MEDKVEMNIECNILNDTFRVGQCSENKKTILCSCTICGGNTLFVDLDVNNRFLIMGCHGCTNRFEMPIKNLDGFCSGCWEDYDRRDEMYSKLIPLYDYWNTLNAVVK